MMEATKESDGNPAPGRSFEAIKQDLSQSLLATKKPTDFIITLIYCIPVLAPIRICTAANVFQRLAQSDNPLSIGELATTFSSSSTENVNDVDEKRDFLVRMLRAVSAIGLIDETSAFTYQANELTRTLADPGFAAGFELVFDNVMGPGSTMAQMLPHHQANGWMASPTAKDGPWQRARNTVGTSTFDSWIKDDPIQLTRLNALMQRMQRDRPHWSEWFPADALFGRSAETASSEQVFFVDVGGGRGHDITALAKKYEGKSVRMVLQDLPSVIEEGEEVRKRDGKSLDSRIALSTQDFFQPQVVKGAQVYYMHKIMHDWPDRDCVKILSHLKDAMSPSSRILVNDVVLPNKSCPLLHTAFDIDMLLLHTGKERDEEMWERLVGKVGGLKVQKFWHPPAGEGEGIIEIVTTSS
ncbi:S-adenosyl-L-methionine-dependent methyltransferase [Polychaeton citri CBS 116435]|uniref:S-adenosyl-L-methionine-dependent methyltransferase n=1 Tax=Polychaeton citri CBS 116435 TaxID=1314669 RepID=A0A9P4QCT3_9PEZI|nr:S-adenosyl-L-methionine-dependent methyltransferase [Polychaeton citri CBS 116435]